MDNTSDYRESSFEEQKEQLQKVEERIHSLGGYDPTDLNLRHIEESREELMVLFRKRRCLLDWMFLETEAEYERMKQTNACLFLQTKMLFKKMEDISAELLARPKDSFTDDYEVLGILDFHYNEESSVLPYPGDEVYGSDYHLMISLYDFLRDSNSTGMKFICRYEDCKNSLSGYKSLDDGTSWSHAFDGIIICHTTHTFLDKYPVFDVLHMNDFWNEVHVWHQHFATISEG